MVYGRCASAKEVGEADRKADTQLARAALRGAIQTGDKDRKRLTGTPARLVTK